MSVKLFLSILSFLTVSLTAPSAGTIQSGSNATVTASVTDPNTGATITGVNFYAGTNFIGSSTASPYTITWAQPVDGTYSLTATAIDSFDATGTSSGVSVTVGTPIPVQAFANACSSTPQTLSGTLSVNDGTSPFWGPQHYANDFTFQATSAPEWVVISQQSTALDSLATLYDDTFTTTITTASSATPIVVTDTANGLYNGEAVTIAGVSSNANANGAHYAGSVAANAFSLYTTSGLGTPVGGSGSGTGGTATSAGQTSYTDLVIDSSGSTSTISSSAKPFPTVYANQILVITGGTGFTPGAYLITSVNSSTHVATVSGNLGTNGSTAGVGSVTVLAYNDDSQGTGQDAQIVYELPAVGTYTIEGSSAAPYQTGPFTVTLTCPSSTPGANVQLFEPGNTTTVDGGTIAMTPTTAAPPGQALSEQLTLTNNGNEDAAISGITASTSGGGNEFTVSGLSSQLIPAGSSVTFTLTFYSTASNTTYYGTLNVNFLNGLTGITAYPTASTATTASGVAVSGLSLPTPVVGGTSPTGKVILTSAAPSGGQTVTLSSANTSKVTVPSTVTVLSGNTSATFTLTTSTESSGHEDTVAIEASTAANYGAAVQANITLTAASTPSVSLNTPTSSPSPITTSPLVIGQGSTITLTAPTQDTGANIAYVTFHGALNGGMAQVIGQQDTGVVSGPYVDYSLTWNSAAVGTSWSVYAVATDTNGVTATSSDQTFGVQALSAVATPTIAAKDDTGATLLSGGTSTGFATVTFSDTATGASIYYTTNGTAPSQYVGQLYNGNSPVTLDGPSSGSTTYTVQAIAYAPNYSASSVASATYTVSAPSGASPTVVAITSPASGTVTNGGPSLSVTGTVTCSAATTWELDYSEGNAPWTPFASGSLSAGGGSVSHTLDTTLLLNGQVNLRLLVTTSGGRQAVGYATFTLQGDLKVGYFTLSYNDMTIPVAGMPIQITRTYDSRDKSSGAFGVGWTLSTSNVKLFKSVSQIGESWEQTESLLNYYVEPIGPANYVSVTMPNGDTYNFAAELDPYGQSFEPLESSTVVYSPIGETNGKATLVPVGDPSVLIPSGLSTPISLLEGDGIHTYDTDEFQMTLHNGSTLDIVAGQGLQWVSDINGNTVYFNLTGTNPTISEQNLAGTTVRTVTIGLGGNGLITSITDPDGAINPDGHTVSYNNASGNLDSYTDQNGNTTSYEYDATHDLLQINAPNGARPIENYYNSSGRLTSSVDANGNTISYSYTTGTVSGVTGSVGSETVTDRNDNSTMMVYDGNGNVINTQTASVKDANGSNSHTVTTSAIFGDSSNPDKPTSQTVTIAGGSTMTTAMFYDAGGDLTKSIQTHNGATLTTAMTYDGYGHLLTKQSPLRYGTSVYDVTNKYDPGTGNLLSSTDAVGNTATYTYDPTTGYMLSMTDPSGHMTSYGYDDDGNCTSVTDGNGVTTTMAYDPNGWKTSASVAMTNQLTGLLETATTQYVHDGLGNVTQTIDPPDGQGNVASSYTYYNSIGKVAHSVDAEGRTTYYQYDNAGNLTQTTYQDGSFTKTRYDANGNPQATEDQVGRYSGTQYDAMNRAVRTGPLNATTPISSNEPNWLLDSGSHPIYSTTFYNDDGTTAENIDEDGNATTYAYDDLGREVTTTEAITTDKTETAYDADGNVFSVTDPNKNTTTTTYDADDRPYLTTYPDNSTSSVIYNGDGLKEFATDQNGYTTAYGYDGDNRLVSVRTPLGHTTQYVYDQVGNKISQIDANGHVTKFAYDMRGQLIEKELPLGSSYVESMTYNLDGTLATQTDYNGKTTTYEYYPLTGRLEEKVPDSSLSESTVSYTYFNDGNVDTATRGSVEETYGYDGNRGWLTSVEIVDGSISNTVSYIYDDAGNKHSVTSPYGTTTYTYDADNRLASVISPDSATTTYTYDFAGNRQSVTRGTSNCIATTYKYDALNRLTDLDNSFGPSFHYTLDGDGRRTAVTDSVAGTTQYLFDHDGRLLSETPPTGSPKTYVYDNVGNRVSSSGTTWTYDNNDRLESDGTNSYVYDSNGNETSNGTITNAYDFENHLVSSGTSSYVYDADGNRVQQTVSSTVTNYVIDFSQDYQVVIEERNSSNGSVAHYDYGDDLVRMDRGGSAYYYIFDGLGSTRALTNASGGVTDTWTYDAFGNSTHASGSTVNPYLFNGQAQDSTGLYFLRARYYDPAHGRFLSQDPFGGNDDDPASLHRYTYAGDNPVTNVDPGGKEDFSIAGIGAAMSVDSEMINAEGGCCQAFLARFDPSYGEVQASFTQSDTISLFQVGSGRYDESPTAGVQNFMNGFVAGLGNGAVSTLSMLGTAVADTQSFGLFSDIMNSYFTPQQIQMLENPFYATGPGANAGKQLGMVSGLIAQMALPGEGAAAIAADTAELKAAAPVLDAEMQDAPGWTGCFVAGTYVHMADGLWKHIENVKVGDMVLSRNPKTGKTDAKTVTQTFVHYKKATLLLMFADGNIVEATPLHPFYVKGSGFVEAAKLKMGDLVITGNGIAVKLSSKHFTNKLETVYNLEVADNHTYFVGRADGGLWVHNLGDCTEIAQGLKAEGKPGEIYRLQFDPAQFSRPERMDLGNGMRWNYHDVLYDTENDEVYDPMTYGHENPIPFDTWSDNFPFWDAYLWGPGY